MLTKEDLQAIGALIKVSEDRLRKDIITKSDLEINNKVLGTIFKVEMAGTNKQIEAIAQDIKELKKGQEGLEQKLDKAIQNMKSE